MVTRKQSAAHLPHVHVPKAAVGSTANLAQSTSSFFTNPSSAASALLPGFAAFEPVSTESAMSVWSTLLCPHLHMPNSIAVRLGSYLTHSTLIFEVIRARTSAESCRVNPASLPAAALFASASGEWSFFALPHLHSPKLADSRLTSYLAQSAKSSFSVSSRSC